MYQKYIFVNSPLLLPILLLGMPWPFRHTQPYPHRNDGRLFIWMEMAGPLTDRQESRQANFLFSLLLTHTLILGVCSERINKEQGPCPFLHPNEHRVRPFFFCFCVCVIEPCFFALYPFVLFSSANLATLSFCQRHFEFYKSLSSKTTLSCFCFCFCLQVLGAMDGRTLTLHKFFCN